MKNKPLFVQIWLVIAGITTGIALLLLIVVPPFLHSFFTREIYSTIEDAQNSLFAESRLQGRFDDRWLTAPHSTLERDQVQQNIRTVRHALITEQGLLVPTLQAMPAEFRQQLVAQAALQTEPVQRYVRQLNGGTMYYIIRIETFGGNKLYVLSYMWDAYRNKLVRELSSRLLLIMGLIMLFSWIPALALAKYLSRPLVKLEGHMKRIAGRKWTEPVDVDRKDEIGRLAQSIEETRQQLVRRDEAQQTLLQHISHELKTPVMVIRSYAQSIQDGLFPKDDLRQSVEVIDQEAERLEKRIRSLLYLTKLDYLATHSKPAQEPVALEKLAEEAVSRLRWRRPELIWDVRLAPLVIRGDRDQWTVALENLLDNQIRYAKSAVSVTIEASEEGDGRGTITIVNDGPPIDEQTLAGLFEPFRKGRKGEFGLGLAIVQRIAALHGASVNAANTEKGVEFRIRIGGGISPGERRI